MPPNSTATFFWPGLSTPIESEHRALFHLRAASHWWSRESRSHIAEKSRISRRTADGYLVFSIDYRTVRERLYPGRIVVEPHFYLPENGHYLNYVPGDPRDRDFGMVFETEEQK